MSQNAVRQLSETASLPTQQPQVDNSVQSAISVNSKFVPFSKFEKLIVTTIVASVILIMLALITIRTDSAQSQRQMQDYSAQTTKTTNYNAKLRQEISELSNSGRLLDVAQKRNLYLQDNNIRNISK